MKFLKLSAQIGLILTFIISTSLAARAQTRTELALPSLSIFGFPLPPSPENAKFDYPFTSQELESFLDEANRVKKDYPNIRTRPAEKKASFIIPFVFYRSRHLFKPQNWTRSDMEEGQLLSRFFARLVDKPELEITATDQASFGRGLQNLRDWFAGLTQNNQTLAAMLFTFDDGPYSGQKVDERRFNSWKRLKSATIPGMRAKFVLMTDNQAPEPMIIGVMNADNSLRWAKRYSNDSGSLSNASMGKGNAKIIEGYGYQVFISSGGESSVVYLDEKLNLRFYFVSW